MLNTFGTVRDLKYLNNTQGTGKTGTVYGSRDVGMTSSSILNYIENAIFDTNQIRYYSPESGMKDALYQQRRDLGNLMQKLEDQGFTIPESVSSISRAAKTTASTNSKGQAMINSAMASRLYNTGAVSSNAGYSIADTVKNALKAGGYNGIDSTSSVYPARGEIYSSRGTIYPARGDNSIEGNDKIVDFGTGTYIDKDGNTQTVDNLYKGVWGKEKLVSDDNKIYRQFITTDGKQYFLNQDDSNLVSWSQTSNFEQDIAKYKQAYEEWKSLPVDKRPKVWYELYGDGDTLSPDIYNELVMSNFNVDQIQKWFLANPKKIVWKQTK